MNTDHSTTVENVTTTARNANLEDLVRILNAQRDARLDAVVPAPLIHSENGILHIDGMGPDGPAGAPGLFRPTDIGDAHIAEKFGIPIRYLRTLREQRPDMYDDNVNGWLHGWPDADIGCDARNFYARTFTPNTPGGVGIFRALLSDRFRALDNLDTLVACLAGCKDARGPDGEPVDIEVIQCDLSETKMRVRIAAPAIQALAPVLLDRYISPNGGWTDLGRSRTYGDLGKRDPVVFGGFDLTNSETGGGAINLCPLVMAPICMNGMKITADQLRHVHLGSKLNEGTVRWSADTQQRNLELVTSMARDAVATFLDVEYVRQVVGRIEEQAGKKLSKPADAVEIVAQQLRFSDEVKDGVLNHFIAGGQGTAGGILNAVTSFARELEDPDMSDWLESEAMKALDIAARQA